MVMCAVVNCKNNNNKKAKISRMKCRFFSFPKDKAIRDVWIQKCLQQHKFNADFARICSTHFIETDYCLQHRLLNYSPTKMKLKPDAIPSLNLPLMPPLPSGAGSHSELLSSQSKGSGRSSRLKRRNLVKDIHEYKTSKSSVLSDLADNSGNNNEENVENEIEGTKNNEAIQTDRFEQNELLTKLESLRAENMKLAEQIKKLEAANISITKILTKSQIKKLQAPTKSYVKWSVEDIASALSLYAAGPRAYRLLRKRNYPLPGVSTLRRWATRVDVQPGTLEVVFKLMKKSDLPKMERACIILFDEVKIQKMYDYDTQSDSTIGSSNYAQVIMARGICGNWKQPIYYNYDTKVNKKLLYEIIDKLENIGFPVYAINSDLGGGNRGLWKELGISEDKTWFLNPASKKKIYVFADIPHLIKLLRNHFLDFGFRLFGKLITKEPIVKLLQMTERSDLRITHKINPTFLTVKNAKRQKVKTATKLFSHTIAMAISRAGSLGLYQNNNWLECARLFKITNDWFDVFNSKVPQIDSRNSTKAYGLALDEQNGILEEMENIITNLRTGKTTNAGKAKLPFQTGILVSIRSLKLLFEDLKSDFDIKYLLTYHLNQDPLEGFFSIIRSIGGLYDHPTPLQFKYRLRNYILGRNDQVISESANVGQFHAPNLSTLDNLMSAPNNSVCDGNNDHKNYEDNDGNISTVEKDDAKIVTGELFGALTSNEDNLMTENATSADDFTQLQWDGLENLAGFIAFKFRHSENLGYLPPSNDSSNTWVNHVSEGGLMKPFQHFVLKCKQLDKIFEEVNGECLKIKNKYLKEHLDRARHVELSYNVKHYFFKCRMYFRIRALNQSNKELSNVSKRKFVKITN